MSRDNKLTIVVNTPINTVFEFAIDPENTPKWISTIDVEETSEWPVKIGTIYRNKGAEGTWSEYTVTEYEENKIFTLSSKDDTYHVKYTFTPIEDDSTILEYYEWVTEGELETPLMQESLNRLKSTIELR